MMRREKIATLELSMGWLIDLLLAAILLSLLSMPLAVAGEAQPSSTAKEQAQPTVPVQADSETENAMTQALETYSPVHTPHSSVDFLMEGSTNSPLQSPTTSPLQSPAAPFPQKTDEVAMLVAEQCSQNGSAADGVNSCERAYSNGHHATVVTQSSNEGAELKRQTVIEESDADNSLLFKKTIRYRVDYSYPNDQKTKEKELFDITYQPAGKPVTRELMVYEYSPETGKARSLSWTQYKQIGNEAKAELVYHATLEYGTDGNPESGLAEQWDHGKKAETFMNWSRSLEGYTALDPESWSQWEGWIRNVSLQAYLP